MKTITNPVTLIPDAELTREVSRLQRRAAVKVTDARRRLKNELTRMAEAATRQAERLDAGGHLDLSAARHLTDASPLADAVADLREAEMMASTVEEFIADESEAG
jgi:hypothetical protein